MKRLFAALTLLLLPGAALGQEPISQDRAHTLFEEAQVHYRLQEYERALSGFREAYRLVQEPSLLFNIAQCYRLLNRGPEAIRTYEAFLAAIPDTPYRKEVEEHIAALRAAPKE